MRCAQACDASVCYLYCSGKECSQACNGAVTSCNMQCYGSKCIQFCSAMECHLTSAGQSNTFTEQICTYGNGPCHLRMKCSGRRCIQQCKRQLSLCSNCANNNCHNIATSPSNVVITTQSRKIQVISTQASTVQVTENQATSIRSTATRANSYGK